MVQFHFVGCRCKYDFIALFAAVLFCYPTLSKSQSVTDTGNPVDAQRQLDIQRREAQQREQERASPAVHSETQTSLLRLPVEGEQPCDQALRMQLDGPSATQFDWLTPLFNAFAGRCLGAKSLQALHDNLNDSLKNAGYVTSQVILAEPAIQDNVVQFHLMAGRIGQYRLLDPNISTENGASPHLRAFTEWPHTTAWRMAMPAQSGDLLNIRDLDHAAENVQRMGYALEQYIMPRVAAQPGTDAIHDVAIAWAAPSRPWQAGISSDNSSSPAYGRTHVGAQLAWNNLFGLADQTYLSLGGNAEAVGSQRKQYSQAVNFTLPWGYHRFSFSRSSNQSALGVQGTTVNFINRRSDTDTQFEWAYTLYRDGHYKITPEFTLGWRKGSSHIEDVELVVQRRHAKTRGLGVNISWVGAGQQIQTTFSAIQASRRQRVEDDAFFSDEPAVATTRRWNGQWLKAFAFSKQDVAYSLQWDVQSTRHPTPLSADISLGGRYTVRGFTGDRTLSASDGMWLRNEWQFLAWPWPSSAAYLGLDAGKVWGATAPSGQNARWLAGAALGIRAQWGAFQSRCNFDFSVGIPLHGLHFEGVPRPRLVPYLTFSIAF